MSLNLTAGPEIFVNQVWIGKAGAPFTLIIATSPDHNGSMCVEMHLKGFDTWHWAVMSERAIRDSYLLSHILGSDSK